MTNNFFIFCFLQEWTLHQCFSAGMLSRISKSAVHMYERVACVWPAYVWHCVLCCVWCLCDKWMCLKGIYKVLLLLLLLLEQLLLLNQYPWDVFAIFLPRLECLLGSGRSGQILNRVEPEALIQRQTAQPNLGSEDDTRCVVGGDIWSVAQWGSHLPPGRVFRWEVCTISAWWTGSRSGLRQKAHWSSPGGPRSRSTPI